MNVGRPCSRSCTILHVTISNGLPLYRPADLNSSSTPDLKFGMSLASIPRKILSAPILKNVFESKAVLNKSRSSRVLLCSSLMGNLLMMNSWKRYTTDSSALVTMGRSFRVTRGHGYECAGLIDTSDSPYIARYSGNPSSRGCNYCNLWDHKQGHQRELGRRCILRCYRLNKSRHA